MANEKRMDGQSSLIMFRKGNAIKTFMNNKRRSGLSIVISLVLVTTCITDHQRRKRSLKTEFEFRVVLFKFT